MKKIFVYLLILLLFIPLYVNADTCDNSKIIIDSVVLENKTDSVEEIEPAAINDKSVAFNIRMAEVNDFAKYKITIKNETQEDYVLDKNAFNINSKYMDYEVTTEDNSNIIKPNSSKVVHLNIKYANEVPKSEYDSGIYNDKTDLVVNLTNGDTTNPNTGVKPYYVVIALIIFISLTTLILLSKKKYTKYMIFIIELLVLIPINIYALCKYEIKIESNIKLYKESTCISFSEDSWETISQNIKDNDTSCYHVGDTKEVETTDYGTHTVRIANMSTPEECNQPGFSQTACGFVVEFTDIIYNRVMKMDYSVSQASRCDGSWCGWSKAEIRGIINGSFYRSLPEDLQSVITETFVVSGHGTNVSSVVETDANQNFVTTDKLYLVSTREIWEDGSEYDSAFEYSRQLDYYKNLNASSTNSSPCIKKLNNNPATWWARNAMANSSGTFFALDGEGVPHNYTSFSTLGVSPSFRIK